MERISRTLVVVALLVGFMVAVSAIASPAVTSGVIKTRIWNDDPNSILTPGNTYTRDPGTGIESGGFSFDEQNLTQGWANRHNWRFSVNGIDPAVFHNEDPFEVSADVTLTGTANFMEGGLEIAPWWSLDVGGVMMIRTPDGEISCWGGRLPFYNFTAQYGIHYVKGDTIGLSARYVPRDLTEANPAVIQYAVDLGASHYESPWLAFDMGNPAEDPPHGLWGILTPAQVGGYFMPTHLGEDPGDQAHADFANVHYGPTPEPASLALLALGGLALLRRKR